MLSVLKVVVVSGILSASALWAQQGTPPAQSAPAAVDPLAPPEPAVEPPPRADLTEANDLIRAGDYAGADTVLAALREEFPDDPAVVLMHGEVLLALSQPDRALPALQHAAQLDGSRPRVNFQLATALQMTGKRLEALAAYGKEIEVNDDVQVEVMAHLNRALLLEQERRWTDAAAELEAVLALDPARVNVVGDMAGLFLKAGDLDAASGALDRGQELGFRSARYRYSVGKRYYDKKAFEPAIRAFRLAVEIDPGMATAQRSLAGVLIEAGRGAEAVAHLERYLELKPDASDAEHVRARIGELGGG